MSLRLETLKREQERLANEMERAVDKRAVIAGKYNTVIAKSDSKELTQVGDGGSEVVIW